MHFHTAGVCASFIATAGGTVWYQHSGHNCCSNTPIYVYTTAPDFVTTGPYYLDTPGTILHNGVFYSDETSSEWNIVNGATAAGDCSSESIVSPPGLATFYAYGSGTPVSVVFASIPTDWDNLTGSDGPFCYQSLGISNTYYDCTRLDGAYIVNDLIYGETYCFRRGLVVNTGPCA